MKNFNKWLNKGVGLHTYNTIIIVYIVALLSVAGWVHYNVERDRDELQEKLEMSSEELDSLKQVYYELKKLYK